MRRFFYITSFIILSYFVFGFYLANFQIKIFKSDFVVKNHPLYYDYRGVSHVVTSFSKGSATPTEVILEASNAKLDFLFFTDLNIIDRPYNISGYQGHVFSFSNQKVSYLDSHILIYSPNPDFYFDSLSSANAQLHQHFSEEISEEQSFFTVLAHPFKQNHQWTGEYPKGLNGIEVINLRSIWQQVWLKDRLTFIESIFTYPFNPEIALLRLIREPHKEIELWDFLNKSTSTIGLLGNETTAKIFKLFGVNFTFPSYEKSFRFASNHILVASELTGQVKSDRKKIFHAFQNGHFYFAYDSLGNTQGFASYIDDGKTRSLIGSKLNYSKNLKIHIDLPENLQIPFVAEVYKDGVLFFKSNDIKSDVLADGPGSYRIVVKIQPKLPWPDKQRWFGWIYSNPFFIK